MCRIQMFNEKHAPEHCSQLITRMVGGLQLGAQNDRSV